MLRRFFAIPLWQRTAAGFALGIIAGLILREQATVWLQPIGDVYLNLIRMVVAPLVLFTIASSIAKLGEGVGAVLGISLIHAALHVLNDMKTFGEVAVSVAEDGPGALVQDPSVKD